MMQLLRSSLLKHLQANPQVCRHALRCQKRFCSEEWKKKEMKRKKQSRRRSHAKKTDHVQYFRVLTPEDYVTEPFFVASTETGSGDRCPALSS
jgi:predicted nucleic acid-binding Zn ribbon protein